MPAFYNWLVTTFQINPGVNPNVTVASLELSLIVTMLCWHHLFDDYPGAAICASVAKRVIARILIWLGLGSAFGFAWLKFYPLLPFAGNDLGMGFPVMGILAGQFALLMVFLYFNTFFDKWPVVRRRWPPERVRSFSRQGGDAIRSGGERLLRRRVPVSSFSWRTPRPATGGRFCS